MTEKTKTQVTKKKGVIHTFFLIIFLLLSVPILYAQHESQLIDDMMTVPAPKGFEQINIQSLVEKYIPIGSSVESATNFLEKEGFTLAEHTGDEVDQSPKEFKWIRYFDKFFLQPPKYKLIVSIEAGLNGVSRVDGFYIKYNY